MADPVDFFLETVPGQQLLDAMTDAHDDTLAARDAAAVSAAAAQVAVAALQLTTVGLGAAEPAATGATGGDATIIYRAPAQADAYLLSVTLGAVAAGPVRLKVYRASGVGTALALITTVPLVSTGAGVQTLTLTLAEPVAVRAGDRLGLYAPTVVAISGASGPAFDIFIGENVDGGDLIVLNAPYERVQCRFNLGDPLAHRGTTDALAARLDAVDPPLRAVSPLALDRFTGANGTLLPAHAPIVGGPWRHDGGTVELLGDNAHPLSVASDGFAVASLDVGKPDVSVSAETYMPNGLAGVVARLTDAGNYWLAVTDGISLNLLRMQDGALTVAGGGPLAVVSPSRGRITLTCDGDTVTARYLTKTITATSTFNNAATRVGIFGTTSALLDEFAVTAPVAAPSRLVVCDGDSITYGYGGPGPGATYPAKLDRLLGPGWEVVNVGVSGQLAAQMSADAATQVDPLYSAARLRNVVVAMGATNYFISGQSVETAYADVAAYCAGRIAAGWQVLVGTVLPMSAGNTVPGTAEAARVAYNAKLRAGWSDFADGLVDLAADPLIGPAAASYDPALYFDGVHLTPAANNVVARVTRDAAVALP